MQGVTLIDHPILQARVTQLRDKNTPPAQFAEHLRQIAALLLFEMTRSLPLEAVAVETPLTTTTGARLVKPLILVPILRAGLGMVDGMARMLPDAAIGHIGMYRDEETLEPQHYYFRLPSSIATGEVLLVDPMLATGNSAIAAIHLLKKQGATSIRFGCLISCPEGLAALTAAHPDVPIFVGAIDDGLTEKGYITPGLGDAGDRYFGTL